jgi:hypothetical protein
MGLRTTKADDTEVEEAAEFPTIVTGMLNTCSIMVAVVSWPVEID